MECAPWSLFTSSARDLCGGRSLAAGARSAAGSAGCSSPSRPRVTRVGGDRQEAPAKRIRFLSYVSQVSQDSERGEGHGPSGAARSDGEGCARPEDVVVDLDAPDADPKSSCFYSPTDTGHLSASSSLRPRVDTVRIEEFEYMWDIYHNKDSPQILRQLSISKDGGLQVANLHKLWNNREEKLRRVLTALAMAAFVLVNVSYVVAMDIGVLIGTADAPDQDRFLLGKQLWRAVAYDVMHSGWSLRGEHLVVLAELVLLAGLLGRLSVLAFKIVWPSKDCLRWHTVAQLFWYWLPLLSTFSSMKLLHYVSPRVLFTEICLEVSFTFERLGRRHYCRAGWKLMWFVFFRLFCLLVGFDAFLVKLRLTARFVDLTEFHLWYCFVGGIFMFQVLNIVNLSFYARSRLFVFIFGGEDGIVSTHEKAKEYLWNAMLAKRLREVFSPWQYLVLMLSLDDYDFQMLTLKEASLGQGPVRSTCSSEWPGDGGKLESEWPDDVAGLKSSGLAVQADAPGHPEAA